MPRSVSAAIAAAARDPALGRAFGGAVLDARSGALLWQRRLDVLALPASTAKVATAAAALRVLGPDARLVTTVVRGGPGTVVLVGGGDPTLASPAGQRLRPAAASLDVLAARTAAALRSSGIGAVRLRVDTSHFSGPAVGPGWKPAYISAGDVAPVTALMVDEGRIQPDGRARQPSPATAAASAFAARMRLHGITVVGTPSPGRGALRAPVLASVASPPVRNLVEAMLTDSDNDLAEALAREVAGRSGVPRSFAGVAVALRRTLAGLVPSGIRLVDGSGLSRTDRASPRALATLIRRAVTTPSLRPILSGLPVAGFTGTLADRFARSPGGVGAVRAKTGSLTGISALTGIVSTRDGGELVFALLAAASTSRPKAEAALDRLASALGGCGCR